MLGSKEQRTKGMKKQAQELIDQAYERGFKAGKEAFVITEAELVNKSYQQGLDDAWEAAWKIHVMFYKDIEKIFGKPNEYYVYSEISAPEAIAKIKAYEEQKKAEEEEKELCEEAKQKVEALAEDIGLDQMMDILKQLQEGK